ncbi:hypothetical protein PR202_gb16586 [Eleusine coracana subsp. coracana]|uniref:Enhanced disease resistance 4-like N-terminal domain-containing protein n=1 Tax=Eleusine coracana subsp. coracana TaxID=191504 RepID=A0AAV5F0Q4_ELECO|nr:hypothetical protein PR202_gb16586 [Eleusine coracana subsp. coracana]
MIHALLVAALVVAVLSLAIVFHSTLAVLPLNPVPRIIRVRFCSPSLPLPPDAAYSSHSQPVRFPPEICSAERRKGGDPGPGRNQTKSFTGDLEDQSSLPRKLLVEYPSIPVYKCGSCNTVLRAKIRAVHAVQAKSESDVQTNVPSSLKGSPQDCNSICTDEHKIAPSVDQPREAAADGIISSPTKNTNSCNDSVEERAVSVVKNITPAQHQEETCSLIDENTQTPGITVNEMHKKGTGADSSSNLIGDLENPDTRENTNRGKVDKVDMTVMRTLDEKTEAVQREERLHTCEHMHVESHEALIEELERSLSFSSNDDEYFSDEAETNGLSDALRQQMGSRRFMLSGQPNDTSRNDPHGQLIKELEMSFSDAEEPMEQHALDADGNKHDKPSAEPGRRKCKSLWRNHMFT